MKLINSLFFFFILVSANAFNITKILEQDPEFAHFNNLLTQTKIADQINSRNTITVLAVDEAGTTGGIEGLPEEITKKILSMHVILDYYDTDKLNALSKKSALLTTLYQSTGKATGKEGFLNVTVTADGVSFSSAVPGQSYSSKLVSTIAAKPYNISVLKIDNPIIPPSVYAELGSPSASSPAGGPTNSASPAAAPVKASPSGAPAQTPLSSSSSVAPSPAGSDAGATAPSPDSDGAVSPMPEGDGPALSPAGGEGPVPAEKSPADVDGPSASPDASPSSSSGVRVVFSACLLTLVLGLSSLAAAM